MRVVNVCEKNIVAVPTKPVTVPVAGNVSTMILDNITKLGPNVEVAGRYIQNVGANPCFYNFGSDCDSNTNYMGVLAASQQLDCSNHGMRIDVYSTLGTTIAVTLLRRVDNYNHVNIIGQITPVTGPQ